MSLEIRILLLATSIVQLTLGYANTFLSLRLLQEGFASAATGIVLSAYYVGSTSGAVVAGAVIERIGQVRAYVAFAALICVAAVLMPLWVEPYTWSALRVLFGFGAAGIFVTTESWLNGKASPSMRGRVFSHYMIATFAALALGQLLIIGATIGSNNSFNVFAALSAIAILLITVAGREAPKSTAKVTLGFGELAAAAPLAAVGSIASGFIGGALYTLVPAWLQDRGIDRSEIGLIMLTVVIGGLLFQVPIGRLSDRFDRRLMLGVTGGGFACAALMILVAPRHLGAVLPIACALGGFMSTIYPVAVAHAHDRMDLERVVPVSGRLILVNGFGSVVGPLAGTAAMARLGIDGLLYLLAAVAGGLALTAIAASLKRTGLRTVRPYDILSAQTPTLGD